MGPLGPTPPPLRWPSASDLEEKEEEDTHVVVYFLHGDSNEIIFQRKISVLPGKEEYCIGISFGFHRTNEEPTPSPTR